ncbi:hypothetical protein F511_05257 [Dorcoceras hygrometricum]|uniref:Uncharacterized protein n=1 Tax=Dorcoceras hygrometricum TaxID=472368 RepID=A0A2Z7CQV8_9LAMI|nr:hypothetical protein F511_05257 [Dorcoceras hygrometricum]
MSANALYVTLLCLTFLPPFHVATARHFPILPSAPSTARYYVTTTTLISSHKGRSIFPSAPSTAKNYTKETPFSSRVQKFFNQREVKDYMPKGASRSRFVNYQTLGSFRCFSGGNPPKP